MKYSDLTEKQKAIICNGCGGKGSRIPVPEFIFHASCDQHDFYYWRGGLEADRKEADKEFYKWMRIDIRECPLYLRPYYHAWALLYYNAVRLKGSDYFNYGKQKTEADARLLVWGLNKPEKAV